ncbi:MAG: AAA family ATPase [Pseudomonadota bacterium]|nr:AAA family ATPase [Pseudomonadota bacterium]
MLLRRVAVENVRSFLDRADLQTDGDISILIGPNGGGKTNLLDTVVIMLRRYLYASMYAVHVPTAEQQDRYEFRPNDALNQLVLDRHSQSGDRLQLIEVEVEVTASDLENMASMKKDAAQLHELARKKYHNVQLKSAAEWDLARLRAGDRLVYRLENGELIFDASSAAAPFLQYLQLFEIESRIRDEFDLASLKTPIVYLPVNRSSGVFQSSVQLANYNEAEQKRQNDAAISRTGSSLIQLAIGRIAQKYRLLLEKDKGGAASEFRNDPNLRDLTAVLSELGYEWELAPINPLRNEYDVRLKKQGSSFLVGLASSGERELLTYLFAIFALNVRDALIIVDEPELHLHPKWQKTLLDLFAKLASSTGNQFLMATHSPTFVSPESIQYVSRVYSRDQKSHIVRLTASGLPDAKHLFNLVNSQNNERIFFADAVILVEGLSDRIFFEAVLRRRLLNKPVNKIIEVVSVGGKGLFATYQKLLDACHVSHFTVADIDYIEQATLT